jgi:hypothetical protein
MVNSYFVAVDFGGQKFHLEVDANNEKHAKVMVKNQLKFELVKKCKKGTLKEFIDKQSEQNTLQTEKTNENEIHTTS